MPTRRIAPALNPCPICLSEKRGKIDAVLIAAISAGVDERTLFNQLLTVHLPELDPSIHLTPELLSTHIQVHGLSGNQGDNRAHLVMMPNGNVVSTADVESVLHAIISRGLDNILDGTARVGTKDVLEAIDKLLKIRGAGGEMADILTLLKEKLLTPVVQGDAPPNGPYATPPPRRHE